MPLGPYQGIPRADAGGAVTPPPQEPILRIDPGMHTARINRIGVDAACTGLATGSYDKTVRLWRLPEGKLLRTPRPPIGFNPKTGNEFSAVLGFIYNLENFHTDYQNGIDMHRDWGM